MHDRPTEHDLIEFLRREAPTELERLESIARIAATARDSAPGRTMPGDASYAAWLEATFGTFRTTIKREARFNRRVPAAA